MKLDRLRILTGGAVHEPAHHELHIGRAPDNDLVVDHPEVDERHARVALREPGLVLVDLRSTAGTFLNGRRINRPEVLHLGDVVHLGPHPIRLFPTVSASGPWSLPETVGQLAMKDGVYLLAKRGPLELIGTRDGTLARRAPGVGPPSPFAQQRLEALERAGVISPLQGGPAFIAEPVAVDVEWLSTRLFEQGATFPAPQAAEIGAQLRVALDEVERLVGANAGGFRPIDALLCEDGRVRLTPDPRWPVRQRGVQPFFSAVRTWRTIMRTLVGPNASLPTTTSSNPRRLADFLRSVAGVALRRQRELLDELRAL